MGQVIYAVGLPDEMQLLGGYTSGTPLGVGVWGVAVLDRGVAVCDRAVAGLTGLFYGQIHLSLLCYGTKQKASWTPSSCFCTLCLVKLSDAERHEPCKSFEQPQNWGDLDQSFVCV